MVTELLQQVGLNKYEAEAYAALVLHGPLTGYELGKKSGVPLSRSYEILERLIAQGLALQQPDDPPRYRAEPPEQFVARTRAATLTTLDALGTALAELARPAPADGFSVRWTRTLNLAAGTYRFVTYTDDGARLKVDGQTVIDRFVAQSPTEWQADVTLTAGDHVIVMEYFEGVGDALARLSYSTIQTDVSPGVWKGEYFTNPNLSGSPLLVRGDPTIDFDWGAGSPAANFPTNSFSVRWSRTLTLSAGSYRFATYTDDGVRLKIDGATVIDHFSSQSPTYYEYAADLAAGNHTVVMEYFEGFGNALAKLSWARRAAAGEGIIRINAGGSAYADSFNNFWEPDGYFTNANATAPITATQTEEAQPIWNTTDDPLYINEHATAFRYNLPIPNGNYTVRLHFAELFFNSPGVRRFNVDVQGQRVLAGFDIYGQAGKAALITKSFDTTVTSATLSINFTKLFDNCAGGAEQHALGAQLVGRAPARGDLPLHVGVIAPEQDAGHERAPHARGVAASCAEQRAELRVERAKPLDGNVVCVPLVGKARGQRQGAAQPVPANQDARAARARRPRQEHGFIELKEAPCEAAGRVAAQQACSDFDALTEARKALGQVEQRKTIDGVLAHLPARAQAQRQPPARKVIHGGGLARHDVGVAKGNRRDQRAKLNPPGVAGEPGQRDP
ncbi:hypothetical protein SE17_05000 [Kouleothrix aurantiaca]|uniref:PA14 domain-containing protein n=1 Tax=Kouleothrix aurantiaca TaxID=186479 RepID=A0A0P9D900_9CHLR|nr:hypothetical protein SE17_05000 [Kouleothrix aurantiaca]